MNNYTVKYIEKGLQLKILWRVVTNSKFLLNKFDKIN